MTSAQKDAYRHLLYCAFLEIRRGRHDLAWWNPRHWLYAHSTLPGNKRLADDFHNLAFFSREDIRDFDEEKFWVDLKRSSEDFHRRYRRIYDQYFQGQYLTA